MYSLGNKFQTPRLSLGGKLEGTGNALGGKVKLGSKANNKLPRSLQELQQEKNKKSPLERR
jgi:hypothetical protein